MAQTTAKGLLIVFFLGTMSMMASAENVYPDDNTIKDAEEEDKEGRFLFGTATALGQNGVSVTLGNEALLLIPLAFLGLLLIGAVIATLFGIGGLGDTGAVGYDTYSSYDVMRSGLNNGYHALEASSYAIARSLQEAAKKYL